MFFVYSVLYYEYITTQSLLHCTELHFKVIQFTAFHKNVLDCTALQYKPRNDAALETTLLYIHVFFFFLSSFSLKCILKQNTLEAVKVSMFASYP